MTNTVLVNGNSYNDGAVAPNNMGNGGFRTYLMPMLSDTMVQLNLSTTAATNSANNAATSASSALNAPGTSATSATNLTIAPGAQSLVLGQVGKLFVPGQTVVIASTASPLNWMLGTITAFTAGTGAMTVNVSNANGAGNFSAWNVALSALPATTFSNATSIAQAHAVALSF